MKEIRFSKNWNDVSDNFFSVIKHPAFISLTLGIALILGIVFLLTVLIKEEELDTKDVVKVERFWGNPEAKIVVEYYSDLECPYCAMFWQDVESKLKEKYSDKIKFVFVHFPLLSIHSKALLAAEAAEAAGAQGRFFEYIDVLYSKHSDPTEIERWNKETLVMYASEAGVPDLESFRKALESRKYRSLIKTYIAEGEKRGVNATPTLFINGEKLDDISLEGIESKIDKLLAEVDS